MRRLFIVAALAAVLATLAWLAVSRTLGSDRLRAAVEARLSAMLGQPVSIGRLHVDIFPRVAVSGRDVRLGTSGVRAPGLDIARVRILPQVRSLWSDRPIVEQIDLEALVISVLRDRQGGWHVPYVVPAAAQGSPGGVAIQRVRVTNGRVRVFEEAGGGSVMETASVDDLQTDVEVAAGALRLAPIAARIATARIAGEGHTDSTTVRFSFAADRIADADLPAFLRLAGTDRPGFLRLPDPASASVAIQVNRASARLTGTGMLRAPQVLLDAVRLQHLEAPLALNGMTVKLDPTTAVMYGGAHRGALTVDLAGRPPAWTAASHLTGVAIGEFLRALSGRDQRLDGVASIDGVLGGRIGEPLDRTLDGRVQVVVSNGVIRDFPLIATINRVLRLAEQTGNDTRFERLSATLNVNGGQATTDDLMLQAGSVRVNAAGRIGADRSLALRGWAVVSPEAAARAVAGVSELARLRNSRGEIEVPLTVSGTLDSPSIGLDVEAGVRKGLAEEIRRRLRRIFR